MINKELKKRNLPDLLRTKNGMRIQNVQEWETIQKPFWLGILLKEEYVNRTFEKFGLRRNVLLQIQVSYATENFDCMHYFIKYSERKIKKQQMQENFCIEPVILKNIFVAFELVDGTQEIYFQWNFIHKQRIIKTLPKHINLKKNKH